METGIIYEWRNKLNDKFYVGQTIHPEGRYKDHLNAKEDSVFHRAIRLYGIENFEYSVVATYEHETEQGLRDLLDEAEKERIKFRNSIVPNGYNVSEGGGGGNMLKHLPKEEYDLLCEYFSICQIERFNGENAEFEREKTSITTKEGMKRSGASEKISKNKKQLYIDNPELVDKFIERITGNKFAVGSRTEQQCKNIGDGVKRAYDEHPEYRDNMSIIKKKQYEEHPEIIEKIRQANLGKHPSDETCAKISEQSSGRTHINNGKIQKFVKVEEIDYWLAQGFVIGVLDSMKEKVSKSSKNTTFVNNGVISKRIPICELDYWLSIGWVRKRLPNKK